MPFWTQEMMEIVNKELQQQKKLKKKRVSDQIASS